MPIECRSFQIKSTLLIDHDIDAVAVNLTVGRVVKLIVGLERIAETTASSGRDADSQKHGLIELLFLPNSTNFACRLFGNRNRHLEDSSENDGGNHLLLQICQELNFQASALVDMGT